MVCNYVNNDTWLALPALSVENVGGQVGSQGAKKFVFGSASNLPYHPLLACKCGKHCWEYRNST